MEINSITMQKRILVIASITDIAPAKYLVEEFKKLGCELLVISDQKYENVDLVATGAVNIRRICDSINFEPMLIIFVEGGNMNLFPISLERFECPTIWWGIDSPHNFMKHIAIARLFDHTFLAQKEYVVRLKEEGIQSVSWMPLAFPSNSIAQTDSPRAMDVAYVGSMDWDLYPQRKRMLDQIANNFPNSYIEKASADQMLEIYQKSKIVFNFSFKNDINMRIFEAMGSGAVLVTNKIESNGMEDLFKEATHYLNYSAENNLIDLIKRILQDPELQASISENARDNIIRNHTYEHRASEILSFATPHKRSQITSNLDTLIALMKMNFFLDSWQYFVKYSRKYVSGGVNKIIISFFVILNYPIMGLLRVLDRFIRKIKKLK
jgi:glycosyltransferase involved in cell wall biosynthesis